MSDDTIRMTEVERRTLSSAELHRNEYLESGGARGHIRDFTKVGGYPSTPTLLLETFGRKSGERRVAPLIYGAIGGEYAIVASKGGADVHPGWYWNLRAMPEVTIQIATQAYRASWREPADPERSRIWDYMAAVFPPYPGYQQGTARPIPLILLKPIAEVEPMRP